MNSVEITLPKLGETVTEGTILRWYKRVGDRVAPEEPLFEVSTDKVDTEIPCPVDGIVAEICVQEGATVAVGTVCMVVNADVAVTPTRATRAMDSTEQLAQAERPGRTAPKHQLSPLVRRLLREHQIDQTDLRGTGREGRIRREDVQARIVQTTLPAKPTTLPAKPTTLPAKPTTLPAKPTTLPAKAMTLPAKAMTLPAKAAMMIAPPADTVVTLLDIDVTQIDRVVRALGATFQQREHFALTPAPFIARAVIESLHHHPELTAGDPDTHAPVHLAVLGTRVDPVAIVAHADTKRLAALARCMLGRDHEPEIDGATDHPQATFGIAFGPNGTQTLRLPLGGTCATLAVGGITRRVIPMDDGHGNEAITVRPVATFALAHRSDIDGAPFLTLLAEMIRVRRWEDELP